MGIKRGYKGLQGLQKITGCYNKYIQGVTRRFGTVSRAYKGVQGATTTTTITLFIRD